MSHQERKSAHRSDFPKKEVINKKFLLYFSYFPRSVLWTDLHQIWFWDSCHWRNQLWQMFWQSNKGGQVCGERGPKISGSHRQSLSLLILCCLYRAASGIALICTMWQNTNHFCQTANITHTLFTALQTVQDYPITNLDFTEARDSEWQCHQLGYMQICTSLQTDNHTNTPPLKYYTKKNQNRLRGLEGLGSEFLEHTCPHKTQWGAISR